MRWSPLATEVGDSTWTTRSMAPMSMPSSSELVATRPRSVPALRASSTFKRCSREIEPWWARTSGGASGSPIFSAASSLRRWASRSARRRLLTKISVERWLSTSSSKRGYIDGHTEVRASGPSTEPPGWRRVAGADGDLDVRGGQAESFGGQGNADQRGLEVALDIVGQRFERRD